MISILASLFASAGLVAVGARVELQDFTWCGNEADQFYDRVSSALEFSRSKRGLG